MKKFRKLIAAVVALALVLQVAGVPAVAVEVGEAVDGIAALANGGVIASGYCGGEGDGTNLSWTLTENGVLTISGSGKMENDLSSPFYSVNDEITSVVLMPGVKSVGDYAFLCSYSLTSVTIPDSVTSIGDSAFCDCTSLTSITIPNSVISIGSNAFFGCTDLTTITIPNGVTSIGSSAFKSCTSLTEIIISNSVTSIGRTPFDNCPSLKQISVDNNNQNFCSLDGVLFNKDMSEIITYPVAKKGKSYIIPDSVTNIVNYAFQGCRSLTSVTISDNVTSIGDYAFTGCNSLASVTIPNRVTSIGGSAFRGCNSLTSVTIPNTVTNVGYRAFYNCLNLTDIYCEAESEPNGWKNNWDDGCPATIHWGNTGGSSESIIRSGYCGGEGDGTNLSWVLSEEGVLTISGSGQMADWDDRNKAPWNRNGSTAILSVVFDGNVTNIGECAFSYCTNLISIEIPDSVTSFGKWGSIFYKCSSLTSIVIPDGVTMIGENTFSGCTSLISVEIPNSVTEIGHGAFNGCKSLASIEIPNSVKYINPTAFAGCTSLTSIRIPNSITYIGYSAFASCSNVTSIEMSNNIVEIEEMAFCDCTSLTSIIIPKSVKDMGNGIFEGCSNLTDIYCETESKPDGWLKYWNNGCNATVHWGYKPPVMGDSDGNGELDENDIVVTLGIIKGITQITAEQAKLADANQDGKLDIRDFNYIYNILLKKQQTP